MLPMPWEQCDGFLCPDLNSSGLTVVKGKQQDTRHLFSLYGLRLISSIRRNTTFDVYHYSLEGQPVGRLQCQCKTDSSGQFGNQLKRSAFVFHKSISVSGNTKCAVFLPIISVEMIRWFLFFSTQQLVFYFSMHMSAFQELSSLHYGPRRVYRYFGNLLFQCYTYVLRKTKYQFLHIKVKIICTNSQYINIRFAQLR